jgi:type IV pilus assembly protein PilE
MKKSAGFTLIELMIVVAIVSILVAIAVPAYNDQMRKSRRTEAKQILSDLQLRQEKWRSNHGTYGTLAASPTGIGAAGTSAYYTVTLTAGSNTATGYIFTAVPSGDQAADSCGTLTLRMVAGVVEKLPATGCW